MPQLIPVCCHIDSATGWGWCMKVWRTAGIVVHTGTMTDTAVSQRHASLSLASCRKWVIIACAKPAFGPRHHNCSAS